MERTHGGFGADSDDPDYAPSEHYTFSGTSNPFRYVPRRI
jgi:hypothetical protein